MSGAGPGHTGGAPREYRRWVKAITSAFILGNWLLAVPQQSERLASVVPWARLYPLVTGQAQSWPLFAGLPRVTRYTAATVHYADGGRDEFPLPRPSRVGGFHAWRQGRELRLYDWIASPGASRFGVREDLARSIARRAARPGRVPVRVVLTVHALAIPARPRSEAASAGWIDFTAILRDEGAYDSTVALDYRVPPGDRR